MKKGEKLRFFIYSKETSKCCNERCLIVQSRQGGFITQNCLKCGKPNYVREEHLPELECICCGNLMKIERVDGKNYFYVCKRCGKSWKIGDFVPSWEELFEYSGLGFPDEF